MILKSKQEIRTNYNTNKSLLQYLYWRRDAYLWLQIARQLLAHFSSYLVDNFHNTQWRSHVGTKGGNCPLNFFKIYF